jgi:hypothetical protein
MHMAHCNAAAYYPPTSIAEPQLRIECWDLAQTAGSVVRWTTAVQMSLCLCGTAVQVDSPVDASKLHLVQDVPLMNIALVSQHMAAVSMPLQCILVFADTPLPLRHAADGRAGVLSPVYTRPAPCKLIGVSTPATHPTL